MKVKKSISIVDLFCGVGGLTHGFVLEGLQVAAGIDLDPTCKFPYEDNNDVKFIEEDISRIKPKQLESLFPTGSIRVLAGCAPCQPFSTYSQRYDTISDGKWSLLNEFGRLVKGVKPEIVTMENVPAVEKHSVFGKFKRDLERQGYKIWAHVIDCAKYGVPQHRKRMVLLASNLGPIELIPPYRSKSRSVKQAIGRLRPLVAGEKSPRDRLHACQNLSNKNLQRIRASRPGGTWRDWPKYLVANCHVNQTGKTYPSVYGRMAWDEPAPTLTTQCYGYGSGRFGHPEQDRAISLREAAILQGFPRNYEFLSPEAKVEFKPLGRLIGNAVPVPLGRAIGQSILKHLESSDY